MHAAFLKKRPYKAKFVIISREASTVDLPRGVNNIKERVVHMHVTINLSHIFCFQHTCIFMLSAKRVRVDCG